MPNITAILKRNYARGKTTIPAGSIVNVQELQYIPKQTGYLNNKDDVLISYFIRFKWNGKNFSHLTKEYSYGNLPWIFDKFDDLFV